jgi:hypothetical protein
VIRLIRKNRFIIALVLLVAAIDLAAAIWNPMVTSRRFYKNDFTKTLYHHDWVDTGAVFYGNSAVTAAYIEEQSSSGLVEMGMSYGKITDLQQILSRSLYNVQGQLVIGIDVHTMLDKLPTDDTYVWFKPRYEPYLFYYRAYFRDSGGEFLRNLLHGSLAYEPRWIDKELYYGHQSDADMKTKWDDYDQRFGWMTVEDDLRDNVDALAWVIGYAKQHDLPLKVIWMPWDKAFPLPPYVDPLRQKVNAMLKDAQIPTLDLMQHYEPKYFSDLVHLNREEGAPLFTKEVDQWLLSFANPSKSSSTP